MNSLAMFTLCHSIVLYLAQPQPGRRYDHRMQRLPSLRWYLGGATVAIVGLSSSSASEAAQISYGGCSTRGNAWYTPRIYTNTNYVCLEDCSVIEQGDLPNSGIEPRSLALQVDSLPTELSGKLKVIRVPMPARA